MQDPVFSTDACAYFETDDGKLSMNELIINQ